jgi:hypothetical protein
VLVCKSSSILLWYLCNLMLLHPDTKAVKDIGHLETVQSEMCHVHNSVSCNN